MKAKCIIMSLTAAASAAVVAAENPYGACAHVTRGEPPARTCAMMRIAGMGWVRSDFDWRGIETKKGEWNFANFDRVVAECEAEGVRLLPILGYSVPWAHPAHEHLDAWGEYVRRGAAGAMSVYVHFRGASMPRRRQVAAKASKRRVWTWVHPSENQAAWRKSRAAKCSAARRPMAAWSLVTRGSRMSGRLTVRSTTGMPLRRTRFTRSAVAASVRSVTSMPSPRHTGGW